MITQSNLLNKKGNICRSPIAEAVFLDLIKKLRVENEWEIDSAAIADWHVGKPPDIRAQVVMRTYNLEYDENKRARQIEENDFRHFDFIFGMDTNNILDLKDISPADGKSKILLLGAFDPKGPKDIRDPYGVCESFITSLLKVLLFHQLKIIFYCLYVDVGCRHHWIRRLLRSGD